MPLRSISAPPLVADSPFDLPTSFANYNVGQEFFVVSTSQTFRVGLLNGSKRLTQTMGPQGLPGNGPRGDPGPTGANGTNGAKGDPGAGVLSGLLSARPAASTVPGQVHYATDGSLPDDIRRSHAIAGAWRVDVDVINFATYVQLYGGDNAGGAACDAAWTAMMADIAAISPPFAPTVRIPRGTYRFANAIHLTRACWMVGDGVGMTYAVTRFQFPPGSAGVIFDSLASAPDGGRSDFSGLVAVAVECTTLPVGPPAFTASHAYALGEIVRPTVRNRFTYVCTTAGTSGASEPAWGSPDDTDPGATVVTTGGATFTAQWAHGIVMRARVRLERVLINGFEGDGVNIYGSVGAAPFSNVNGWQSHDNRISACNGHGVYVLGSDSNAGIGSAFDVDLTNPLTGQRHGLNGIYDNCFINNTWIACQVIGAGLHAYAQDNPANPASTFIGCYAEQGDGTAYPSVTGGNGPNDLQSPNAMIVGGFMHAAGYTDATQIQALETTQWNRVVVGNQLGSIGLGDDGVGLLNLKGFGQSNPVRIQYDASGAYIGSYVWRYGGLSGDEMLCFTGPASAAGAGYAWLPHGFISGSNGSERHVQPRGGYATWAVPYATNFLAGYTTQYLAASVEITSTAVGAYTIQIAVADTDPRWLFNNTAYAATLASIGGGASIVLPAGKAATIVADGTNVRFATQPITPSTGAP